MTTSSHEVDVTSILEAMALEIKGLRSRVGTLENTEIIPGKVKDPSGATTYGLTSGSTGNTFSGNVGIGTTGPSYKLHIRPANNGADGLSFDQIGGGYDASIVYLGTSPLASGWGLDFKMPTAQATQTTVMSLRGSGNVGIGTTGPLSELCINGGLHVGGDSDAGDNNLLVDGTITATLGNITATHGDIVIGTAGHGIDFSVSADTATGTVTGEILNDYEEGTWTPVYSGFGGSIGATAYAARSGVYTKIGRLVRLSAAIVLSNNGDWASGVVIGGIPFTTADVATGSLLVENITYDGQVSVVSAAGASYLYPKVMKTGIADTAILSENVSDTGEFYFTITHDV